jgi:hypothetical protein
MGIFNRGPKLSASDKVRVKAEKAGVSTDGALVVAHDFQNNQDNFLLVFPDRVDIHRGAKIGSLMGSGRGVESYPMSSITSAQTKFSGIWCTLQFTASNVEVEFRGPQTFIPEARDAIMQAKASA